MKITRTLRGLAVFVSVFLFVEPAEANVMVPVIVIFSSGVMILALIPIISS